MCSRHQSKYTRSLYLLKNTLFMAAVTNFILSLSDQQGAQPWCRLTGWYWFLFLPASWFFWHIQSAVIMVGIICAQFYLYRYAVTNQYMQNVSLWNYAEPPSLENIIRVRDEMYMHFPKPEENDPPGAAELAGTKHWDDMAKTRRKVEVALGLTEPEDEVVDKNQAGSNTAGVAGASESIHDLIKRASEELLLGDGSDPQGAQANVRGARGKSPGKVRAKVAKASAPRPKCTVCHDVGLTARFVLSGMCGKCTTANDKKKK